MSLTENAVAARPIRSRSGTPVLNGHLAERPARPAHRSGPLAFPDSSTRTTTCRSNAIPALLRFRRSLRATPDRGVRAALRASRVLRRASALRKDARASRRPEEPLLGATTVAHHDPWCDAFDETVYLVHVLSRFGWSHWASAIRPAGEELRRAALSTSPRDGHGRSRGGLRLRDRRSARTRSSSTVAHRRRPADACGRRGRRLRPFEQPLHARADADPRRLCDVGRPRSVRTRGSPARATSRGAVRRAGLHDLTRRLRSSRRTPRSFVCLEWGGLRPASSPTSSCCGCRADPYEVSSRPRARRCGPWCGRDPAQTDPISHPGSRPVRDPRRLHARRRAKLVHPAVVAVPSALGWSRASRRSGSRVTCDVSVGIPTYNRRDVVAEAGSSELDQTMPPEEVIVVDHGSADGTPAMLVERFGARIQIVRLAHEGSLGTSGQAGLAHRPAPGRFPRRRRPLASEEGRRVSALKRTEALVPACPRNSPRQR
jgi:hypothetical protein